MKKTCSLAVLLMASGLAGAALAQTITPPAPVDGTPTTPAAPGTTTPGTAATPAGTPAAPGSLPIPLIPGQLPGPGTITIIIDPNLLAKILELFRGMAQPGPIGPVPPQPPPLPPLAGPGGLPPGAPDPATLPGAKKKKKESLLPGFPLLVLKGKKANPEKGGLIRTGPGLALTMLYIQQGNQQFAVQTLQTTVQQMEAAKAKYPKLKPGKQAAATRAALQIGLQTAVAPVPGAPVPLGATGTSTGTALLPTGPTSTIPALPGGQAGPPPVPIGQAPGLPPEANKPLPLPPIAGQPPMPPCNPAFVQAVAAAQKQSSPIVFDLNGNGVADVTTPDFTGDTGAFVKAGAAHFDVSGAGEKLRTEWLKPHADGLLVLDSNGNGVVDSATELFGDADGFADGYAKLALLDRNGDHALTGDELSRLSAWVDDGDGTSERGELTPIAALGITRVDVGHAGYVSSFVRNGKKAHSWDWFPRSE